MELRRLSAHFVAIIHVDRLSTNTGGIGRGS